jgi:unsaturated rhamnogalacturonyl hydrolase
MFKDAPGRYFLKLICFLYLVLMLTVSCNLSRPEIISPAENAAVYGDSVKVIVKTAAEPDFRIMLDDIEYNPSWQKEAWPNRWITELDVQGKSVHRLVLKRDSKALAEITFGNILSVQEISEKVISSYVSGNAPESLKWDWAPAVFLYALMKYAPYSLNETRCIDYVRAYHRSWLEKGLPEINWADECPPALSALMLDESYGDDSAMPGVIKAAVYIKETPGNELGSLDHLGSSAFSIVYPDSIWLDSLMMWALLSVQYGVYSNDMELEKFGLDQPFIFSDKLRNPETGLFHHAWNIEAGSLIPKENAFWLRGNAWVMVSVLEMICALGENHEKYFELCSMFKDLAKSARTFRQPSGYWDTVMAEPGYAYEESSGSALIAYTYAKGYRLGLLDESYLASAQDTFSSITARLKKSGEGYLVTDVSSGTIPSTKLGYKLVPTSDDIPYGVGAYLMLASEMILSGY